jgi:hypothetical protein
MITRLEKFLRCVLIAIAATKVISKEENLKGVSLG